MFRCGIYFDLIFVYDTRSGPKCILPFPVVSSSPSAFAGKPALVPRSWPRWQRWVNHEREGAFVGRHFWSVGVRVYPLTGLRSLQLVAKLGSAESTTSALSCALAFLYARAPFVTSPPEKPAGSLRRPVLSLWISLGSVTIRTKYVFRLERERSHLFRPSLSFSDVHSFQCTSLTPLSLSVFPSAYLFFTFLIEV